MVRPDIENMDKEQLVAELKKRQIPPYQKAAVTPRPNHRYDEVMIGWISDTNAMLKRVQEI